MAISDFKSIRSIRFSVYSTDEIRQMATCTICNHMIHKHYIPQMNSVNDLRLGTSDKRLMCSTCVNDVLRCSGHSGVIELTEPVYHPGFIKYIFKILRCVCYFCSRIRVSATNPKYPAYPSLSALLLVCTKYAFCDHCGGQQPEYLLLGCSIARRFPQNYLFVRPQVECEEDDMDQLNAMMSSTLQAFTPRLCRMILTDIRDEDLVTLGFRPQFTRPENFVLEVLLVPAVAIRPYNNMFSNGGSDNKSKGQSESTLRLIKIVKENESLSRLMVENPRQSRHTFHQNQLECMGRLQHYVAEYLKQAKVIDLKKIPCDLPNEVDPSLHMFDVSAEGYITHKPNQIQNINALKQTFVGCVGLAGKSANSSITQHNSTSTGVSSRIGGKEGRLRANLCAKRVNLSARSVISPDVVMDIDVLGVPKAIASQIVIPEMVCKYNIDKLTRCVKNGYNSSYGAKRVHKHDSITCVNLKNTAECVLECGDVVDRYLCDNDWVLFNRQPTLHKESIVAFKVHLVDGYSFRLPLPLTRSFGADYDGDEMNMHKVASIEADAEMRYIMSVENNIVTPTNHSPLVACVMDSTLGSYLLTERNIFLTKSQVCDLCMVIHYTRNRNDLDIFNEIPEPCIVYPRELWSGKQIVSLLFPTGLHVSKTFRSQLVECERVRYDWEENYVCIRHGELLYGALCKKTIGTSGGNIVHNIANDYGGKNAVWFISDLQRLAIAYLTNIAPFSVGLSDCVIPSKARNDIDVLLNDYVKCVDEVYAKSTYNKEIQATNILSSVLPKCSAIIQHELLTRPSEMNRFLTMMVAGSKGNSVNIAQIMGCVGQQIINGSRIALKSGGSIPCFSKGDHSPESGGFVFSSYIKGLNPHEFFFHSAGGRQGLIDTAVKTADTGYLQRRIVKSMESHHVTGNCSVRNAKNNIIQLQYGGNNIDTSKLERVIFKCLYMKDESLINYILFKDKDVYCVDDIYFNAIQAHINKVVRAKYLIQTGRYYGFTQDVTNEIILPLSASRTFDSIYQYCAKQVTGINIAFNLSALDALERNIYKYFTDPLASVINGYVRSEAGILYQYQDVKLFQQFCDSIDKTLLKARIQPGEMVGIVAATSIGEPTTQLTLQTFHFAGCGSQRVTQGVPRMKELLDVCENTKTPSLKIYLKPPWNTCKDNVDTIACMLEFTTFADFIERYMFLDGEGTCGSTKISTDILYYLNITKLIECKITIEHVVDALYDFLGSWFVYIQNSDETEPEWWIRIHFHDIRPIMHAVGLVLSLSKLPAEFIKPNKHALIHGNESISKTSDTLILKEFHKYVLDKITISGINGIKKTYVSENKMHVVTEMDGCYETHEQLEYIITTDGTALQEVLQLPFVDCRRTYSNHVTETCSVMGIYAASRLMLHEITNVLLSDGGYVAESHIRLLVDTTSSEGVLFANNRHGVVKHTSSVLARAAFEESNDVLEKAAVYGEIDNIRGVSESIMVGRACPAGTGTVNIFGPSTTNINKMTSVLQFEHVKNSGKFDEKHYVSPNVSFTLPDLHKYIPMRSDVMATRNPMLSKHGQINAQNTLPWD